MTTFVDYQKALAEGRLLCSSCKNCNECAIPPRIVCKNCQGRDLVVEETEKRGVIRTFTVIRIAPLGFEAPYIVAMVETGCGAWVMGNLLGVEPDSADMDLMGKTVSITSRITPADTYSIGEIHTLAFELSEHQ